MSLSESLLLGPDRDFGFRDLPSRGLLDPPSTGGSGADTGESGCAAAIGGRVFSPRVPDHLGLGLTRSRSF